MLLSQYVLGFWGPFKPWLYALRSSKTSHRIAKQFLRHHRFLSQRSCRLLRDRRQLSYRAISTGPTPQAPTPSEPIPSDQIWSVPLPTIRSETWLVQAKVQEPHGLLNPPASMNVPGFSLCQIGYESGPGGAEKRGGGWERRMKRKKRMRRKRKEDKEEERGGG